MLLSWHAPPDIILYRHFDISSWTIQEVSSGEAVLHVLYIGKKFGKNLKWLWNTLVKRKENKIHYKIKVVIGKYQIQIDISFFTHIFPIDTLLTKQGPIGIPGAYVNFCYQHIYGRLWEFQPRLCRPSDLRLPGSFSSAYRKELNSLVIHRSSESRPILDAHVRVELHFVQFPATSWRRLPSELWVFDKGIYPEIWLLCKNDPQLGKTFRKSGVVLTVSWLTTLHTEKAIRSRAGMIKSDLYDPSVFELQTESVINAVCCRKLDISDAAIIEIPKFQLCLVMTVTFICWVGFGDL